MTTISTQTPQPQVAGAAGHHGHHHGGGGAARKAVDDSVAKALGMSTDDLKAAEQQGQSLADIATAKGVSADKLQSAITDGLKQASPTMSADRLQSLAGKIASAKPHEGGARGPDAADGQHSNPNGSFSLLAGGFGAAAPTAVDAVA